MAAGDDLPDILPCRDLIFPVGAVAGVGKQGGFHGAIPVQEVDVSFAAADGPHRLFGEMCIRDSYGSNRYDAVGLLQSGVLLRHLILPGQWQNTEDTLRLLAQNNPHSYPLSLLPDFVPEGNTAAVLPPPYTCLLYTSPAPFPPPGQSIRA